MSQSSTSPGYLIPLLSGGAPVYDQALENLVHDILMGLTGIPGQYVRPAWQPEPPAQPAPSIDWVGFSITAFPVIEYPAVTQLGSNTGDVQYEHEDIEILCSFYGPDAAANMSLCRAGLYVAQNRDMMKSVGLNFVGTDRPSRVPDLVNVQWINRVDLPVKMRRKLSRTYNVLSLDPAQAAGPNINQSP
jgi:hypothetical protein